MAEDGRDENATGLKLPSQLLRYGLVGSFNTALSYGVYALLTAAGLPVALSSLGSLLFGICLSFVTLGRLVFMSRLRGRFRRFVIVWAVLYVVNLGLITLAMRMGIGPYVSGLLAAIPTIASAFILQRIYVFR